MIKTKGQVIIILSFLLCASLHAGEARKHLDTIKDFYSTHTPASFHAELEGVLIKKQLQTIPKNMVLFGKKPYAAFYFKKGFDPRIIVLHVEDFYKNMLSVYEELISDTGIFWGIKSIPAYRAHLREYDHYLFKKPDDRTGIKIVEREGLPGDYAVFTADKAGKIVSSKYFQNNKEQMECSISYESVATYLLPSSIELTFLNEDFSYKKMTINFVRYKIAPLPDNLFIE
ncbi:hypothetical protein ACFL6D_00565 [Spirochaetota bacterium]